jgi:hypothetical protein
MANLTNINNKFLVTTGGNVGIGTTSPSQKLHVEGLALIKNNTSGLLYLYDTSNSIYGDINGDAIVTAGNSLRFTVNSSERMRIDSSGGVGIGAGTIPADHRLQIHNPSFTYSRFALTNSATGSASGDGLKFQIENLNAIIKNQENGYLTFGTNGRETDLRIDSSGNVGIGTTSPVVKLAVKSSQEQLTLSEGDLRGATFDYRSSTGNLNIATNGINARTNPQFTLDLNGNVGIGTSSPGTKLDIGGMADPVLRIKSDAGGDPELRFDAAAANRSARIKFYDNGSAVGGFIDYVHNGDKMNFGAGSSTGVTMTVGDGVVGIGTTSPSATLNIKSLNSLNSDSLSDVITKSEFKLQYRADDLSSMYLGGLGSERGYLQSINNAENAGSSFSLNPYGGNVGIGTTSPDRSLDVQEALSIFGSGGTTEIMLRGQVEGTGTVRNVGSFHWSIRGDIGGNNDDLKLVRFVTGTYSGIAMQIQNSTGNVGIGTTSPAEKLEVAGSIKSTSRAIAGGSTAGITLSYDTSNSIGLIETWTSKPIGIETAGVRRMTITSGGNVGIGTTSPASVLHIKDNTAGPTQLSIQSNDFTRAEEINFLNPSTSAISGQIKYYTNPTVEYMSFSTSNNSATVERMRIDSSGNVGIGNTSPTAKLTIDNSISTSYSTTGYAATPANSMLYLNNTNGGSNTASLINFRTGSGDGVLGFVEGGGTNDADFVIQTDGGSNGIERFRITNAGNVGIGSSNADSKFKVELNPSGTVLAGLRIGYNSSSANYFDGDTQYFRNGAGTTERMRITSGGDLCVGVTTALGRIHMHNSGTSYLHISNDTTGSGAGSGTDIGVFSGQSDLQINNREAASVIISTSDTPRLTVNSSGNVGIGRSPVAYGSFRVLDLAGSSGAIQKLIHTGSTVELQSYASSTVGAVGTATNHPLLFVTNDTERMNILAGGTGTFYNAFSIQGDDKSLIVRNAAGTVIGTMGAESSSTPNVGMTTIRNNGTTTIQFNSNGSSYINGGNVGIGETSPNGKLHIKDGLTCSIDIENTSNTGLGEIAFNDPDADDRGALQYSHNLDAMIFKTAASERMRITSAGNVGIGTTSPGYMLHVQSNSSSTSAAFFRPNVIGSGDPAEPTTVFIDGQKAAALDINRFYSHGTIINIRQNNSNVGSISVTGTATSYNTSSDYRLKENYQDFNGLDMVSNIPVYDFKWKSAEERSFGVKAHELQEVLPQAVSGDKDAEEMQGVDYSKIVPLLVKSIQELEARVKELENK